MKIIKNLFRQQFFRSSLVMVVGSNLFNAGQFIYHFLMGRFLGKAYYGDLASIISILGIVTIIHMAFGLTIVKFIASSKDERVISNFIKWVYRWSIYFAAVVALVTFILAPVIGNFLNLSESLLAYLLAPLLFFFIITVNIRSILQGLVKFNQYVMSLMAEGIFKIVSALVLISVGYALWGATFALLLGIIISFLVSRLSITKYLEGKLGQRPEIIPLVKYSGFVFLQGLSLTSMYSADLLLVKHFFSSNEAGIYASLATLGRVIFFGASPVTHVMFPLVVKRYQKGESYFKLFYLSLGLVIGFSLVILLGYIFFPQLAIGLLFGPQFLEGAKLLWLFAIFMTLLAIAMLISQFFLSIGRHKTVFLFILAAILQIAAIWFYHPSLESVVKISIFTAALLNLAFFIYFIYLKISK